MMDDIDAQIWFRQAVGYARDGNLNAAMNAVTTSCVVAPGLAKHWRLLGTLKTMGEDSEAAILAFGRAVKLDPDEIKQALSLAELLSQTGRADRALACLRAMAARARDDERVWINLAYTGQKAWKNLEAARAFRRVSCLNPGRLEYAFRDNLSLPALPRSLEDIAAWRMRYENGIERLRRLPAILTNPAEILDAPGFFLAYHDEDDRRLMETLSRMMLAVSPGLEHEAPWLAHWVAPHVQCRRIRVGFVSEYFSGHTIGKLFQGILRHLDKHRFEVVLIHMPAAKQDEFRAHLETLVDRVVTLPTELSNQRDAVSDLELDVLFYPDIGMTATTYFLAYARLAPVQAVAWGHPDTTGLDTIDYFTGILHMTSSQPKKCASDRYPMQSICI
jgi:protein O-GlcNAc transferase